MLRYLLYPFAALYGLAVWIRNRLFDLQILKSASFDAHVICVGNITVGGTGKTPHVEYLIRLLSPFFQTAMLSRGYRRKTRGFRLVVSNSTALEAGDEPVQVKRKYPSVTVAVDANRARGISNLTAKIPNLRVVLLDDAFQHRYVKPGLSILLTDYNRLFTRDHYLPMGRLRDCPAEKKRADIVVVTKCPHDISIDEQVAITRELALGPEQPVYFTTFEYGSQYPVFSDYKNTLSLSKDTYTIALAGIANPSGFFEYVAAQTTMVEAIAFPDHHAYTVREIKAIFERLSKVDAPTKAIITTEKDAVRLSDLPLHVDIQSALYFVSIDVVFVDGKSVEFNKQILKYARKN